MENIKEMYRIGDVVAIRIWDKDVDIIEDGKTPLGLNRFVNIGNRYYPPDIHPKIVGYGCTRVLNPRIYENVGEDLDYDNIAFAATDEGRIYIIGGDVKTIYNEPSEEETCVARWDVIENPSEYFDM